MRRAPGPWSWPHRLVLFCVLSNRQDVSRLAAALLTVRLHCVKQPWQQRGNWRSIGSMFTRKCSRWSVWFQPMKNYFYVIESLYQHVVICVKCYSAAGSSSRCIKFYVTLCSLLFAVFVKYFQKPLVSKTSEIWQIGLNFSFLSSVWRIGARAHKEEAAGRSLLCADLPYRSSIKEAAPHRPQYVFSCRPGAHQSCQDQILTGTLMCLKLKVESVALVVAANTNWAPPPKLNATRGIVACTFTACT